MNTQRFQHWALYVLFYCYVSTFTALASCYYRNGTDANLHHPTEVYQPCDDGDEDSMCCALNKPDADKCRSDGLCLSVYDGNIWRESCTDRSWKSSKCIKLCDSGIGQYHVGQDRKLANDTFTITPCADGSYCCGNGTIAQSCCDNSKGVFLSDGETTSKNPSATSTESSTNRVLAPTPSTTSSSATVSISTTSTESPNNGVLAPTASTSPENPSSSEKIGIGVGIGLGISLLLGLAIMFLRRHQKRKVPIDPLDLPLRASHLPVTAPEIDGISVPAEMSGLDRRPYEMNGEPARAELI